MYVCHGACQGPLREKLRCLRCPYVAEVLAGSPSLPYTSHLIALLSPFSCDILGHHPVYPACSALCSRSTPRVPPLTAPASSPWPYRPAQAPAVRSQSLTWISALVLPMQMTIYVCAYVATTCPRGATESDPMNGWKRKLPTFTENL